MFLYLFRYLLPLAAGLLLGAGLAVSGMMNPEKVLNFLDVAGHWDPTLLLVMVGAVVVNTPITRWMMKGRKPLFAEQCFLPSRNKVDIRLMSGAIVFGVGWGIAGICPGPGVALVVTNLSSVVWFLFAMGAGMFTYSLLARKFHW
ncbi:MAG: DUF6691 family protein [Endozoicomonas sp.]